MNGEGAFLLQPGVTSSNHFKTNFYIKSKAASLILLWNFSVLLGYRMMYNVDAFIQSSHSSGIVIVVIVIFSVFAVFSPVVGLLTDVLRWADTEVFYAAPMSS